MESRFEVMAESRTGHKRPWWIVINGVVEFVMKIWLECADGKRKAGSYLATWHAEQTQVISQDHETSCNRYGDLRTLPIRSRLRFGEARTTM